MVCFPEFTACNGHFSLQEQIDKKYAGSQKKEPAYKNLMMIISSEPSS